MFRSSNILVIGDLMLDVYCRGEVNRISPEAPVPVFKKNSERWVLGGASNVVANLISAGQKAAVLALLGDDMNGRRVRALFREVGVDSDMIEVWRRPTVTKTRFLAEDNQQVFRMDIEDGHPINSELSDLLLRRLDEIIDRFDLIVLSDYMKGLLTYDFTQGVIRAAKMCGKKVVIDVKGPNYEKYAGAWLLKPNAKELKELTKMPTATEDELLKAAEYLLAQAHCEYVLTTCGAKGMVLVGRDIRYHLDTVGKSVYDVTGAGDTAIAYLSAAIAGGEDIIEAMKIANYAAGIQVGKVGTSVVYLHEVEEAMRNGNAHPQRIFRRNERETLSGLLSEWRSRGETVVTTNGCFDILHRGHISLLEGARKYGDHLIVMMNTDESVKRLKGLSRPINTEEDRAIVIAALDCVDAVAFFDPMYDNKDIPTEDMDSLSDENKRIAREAPMGLMKLIAPDVHVKGGDYTVEQVPEAIYAKDFKIIPFVQGYSTTGTLEKRARTLG